MNLWTRVWIGSPAPLLKFMKNPEYYHQIRAAHVVKRRYPAPLQSANKVPIAQSSYTVLLKDHVTEIGRPGDFVTVKENKTRPLSQAKAAQENVNASGGIPQIESYSSRFAGSTVKLLSNFLISLNLEVPWHIRSAFRKAHVHVPDHAFTMPRDRITSKNQLNFSSQPLLSSSLLLKPLECSSPMISALGGVRSHTNCSMLKGKRKTVKAVIQRFYRLDWGAWIRTRSGKHRKVWRKSANMKRRALMHVFCNSHQSYLLDKMVCRYWRTKKYYVDDPYEPYHKRDDFPITKNWPH